MSKPASEVPRNPDGTVQEYPEQSWTNHFPPGTELHDLYERRVRGKQDIVAIWDDYHQRRGTGKTIGCLQVGAAMDRTEEGLTKDKVCIEPQQLLNAYHEQPKGSALVMDEAEIGASNRSAMTKVNKAIREIVATGRVEEKYVILNSPSWNFVDVHLRSMATLWICTLRKGLAQIHFVENDPYRDRKLTPKKGLIEWRDIDTDSRLRNIYNYLTREKKKHIRGERGESFIPKSEHQEEMKKLRKQVERESRNETMSRIVNSEPFRDSAVRHQDVADAIGLSQAQVTRIVNEWGVDEE